MSVRFTTPVHYVGKIAHRANTGRPVLRKRPEQCSPDQGVALIKTLTELFSNAEGLHNKHAMTVVAGAGHEWYVVGVRREGSSVVIHTGCECHAREMAKHLAELAN